jgi:hypothetical protein
MLVLNNPSQRIWPFLTLSDLLQQLDLILDTGVDWFVLLELSQFICPDITIEILQSCHLLDKLSYLIT